MGRPTKEFTEYILKDVGEVSSLEDYAASPSSIFLYEIVDICDAAAHCNRNFPRKRSGELTQASSDSLGQITGALLATIMGQFELYQRLTFSTAFELTRHATNFDRRSCVKALTKDAGLTVDIDTLMAYRGQPAPIGQLLADQLHGWHSPDKVNSYFKALFSNINFFSGTEQELLRVLWQLRHSMVHTGGWLSLPDAQKVPQLTEWAGQALFLSGNFTEVVVRRLHGIVVNTTDRLDKAMQKHFPAEFLESEEYKKLVTVSSPRSAWV